VKERDSLRSQNVVLLQVNENMLSLNEGSTVEMDQLEKQAKSPKAIAQSANAIAQTNDDDFNFFNPHAVASTMSKEQPSPMSRTFSLPPPRNGNWLKEALEKLDSKSFQ